MRPQLGPAAALKGAQVAGVRGQAVATLLVRVQRGMAHGRVGTGVTRILLLLRGGNWGAWN